MSSQHTTALVITDSISAAGLRMTTVAVRMPAFLIPMLLNETCLIASGRHDKSLVDYKLKDTDFHVTFKPMGYGCDPNVFVEKILSDMYGRVAMAARHHVGSMANTTNNGRADILQAILAPFQYRDMLFTSSNWPSVLDNFLHSGISELLYLGEMINEAISKSVPEKKVDFGFHLPFIVAEDHYTAWNMAISDIPVSGATISDLDFAYRELLFKVSAYRCSLISQKNLSYGSQEQLKKLLQNRFHDDVKNAVEFVSDKFTSRIYLEHQHIVDKLTEPDENQEVRWLNPTLHGRFPGWISHGKLNKHHEWVTRNL